MIRPVGKRITVLTCFLIGYSICPAQLQFRVINAKKGKNISQFSFPLFLGSNKMVVKKINDHIQTDILETTIAETPEKKIFDKTRFIQADTLSQSGYTNIRFHIEVNNSIILSIVFELEGMGAYPVQFKKYYNFNSQTGSLIRAKDLFETERLAEISSFLIDERKNRIRSWIQEMDTTYEKTDSGDSLFIREKFAECNSGADEGQVFLKKHSLIFYKHGCFPHAWGPYETNLDVEIEYKKLENKVNEFGRRVIRQMHIRKGKPANKIL